MIIELIILFVLAVLAIWFIKNVTLLAIIFIIALVAFMLVKNTSRNDKDSTEAFNIPLRSSSAWDWNLGPGYGAGYGTGYAMWGIWPANLPKEPWRNWMWGRRPLIFTTPFTGVPQIDYNDTPTMNSKPISNYNVSLVPGGNGCVKLAVDGLAGKTLQLDRGRNYYFHIYSPGAPFVITDGVNELIAPIEQGMVQLNFRGSDPDVMYYSIQNKPNSGGVIYLNDTRWE